MHFFNINTLDNDSTKVDPTQQPTVISTFYNDNTQCNTIGHDGMWFRSTAVDSMYRKIVSFDSMVVEIRS